jgi:carboxypeptidase PM20D1
MKVKRFISYSLATLLFLLALIFIRAYLHQPDVYEIKAERLLILDETKAIENLSRSIQFQTISHPNYEKFDYEEFQRFLSWLEREYVQVFKNLEKKYLGKTLLLKWQGEAADLNPILLTGHYDVVPVREDADLIWQESPFSGKIDGNYVWGRGALDDKSGVIAILEAVHYLLKNNFSPRRTVYLSFGHDEEIGGRRGAGKVTEFLLKEGVELEWTLDEGSFLLKDIIPGINKPVAVINVAEKGSLTIQVIGKAKGGHSSMPSSKSSVGYLSEALLKLENNPIPGKLEGISLGLFDEVSKQMPFQYKILFANLWLFEPLINNFLSDSPAMNAVIRTTTAPTMLSASNRLNVLASEAVGMVNFRLHPRDNPEKIINFVKDLIGNENIEVKKVSSGTLASSVSDWETEGYRAISNSVREVYGDIIVAPGLMVGGSDSKHYAKAAKNSYRFNPFPLSANELSGLHGIDERIKKDDFLNGIRSYIKIIQSGAN